MPNSLAGGGGKKRARGKKKRQEEALQDRLKAMLPKAAPKPLTRMR